MRKPSVKKQEALTGAKKNNWSEGVLGFGACVIGCVLAQLLFLELYFSGPREKAAQGLLKWLGESVEHISQKKKKKKIKLINEKGESLQCRNSWEERNQ